MTKDEIEPPSFEGLTLAEAVVVMVEHYKPWIDWDNPTDICHKSICGALAFLSQELGDCIPEIKNFLTERLDRIRGGEKVEFDGDFYESYFAMCQSAVTKRTEFIEKEHLEKQEVREAV